MTQNSEKLLNPWKKDFNSAERIFCKFSQLTKLFKMVPIFDLFGIEFKVVDVLLAQESYLDVNLSGPNGINALMIASNKGHVSIMKKLADSKADLNARDNDGNSAFIFACGKGRLKAVIMSHFFFVFFCFCNEVRLIESQIEPQDK